MLRASSINCTVTSGSSFCQTRSVMVSDWYWPRHLSLHFSAIWLLMCECSMAAPVASVQSYGESNLVAQVLARVTAGALEFRTITRLESQSSPGRPGPERRGGGRFAPASLEGAVLPLTSLLRGQASSSGRSVRSTSSSGPSGRQPRGGGDARSAALACLTCSLCVSGV